MGVAARAGGAAAVRGGAVAAGVIGSLAALGLTGCALAGALEEARLSGAAGEFLAGAAKIPAVVLLGEVTFPRVRQIQATYEEVGAAATVSFIDPDLDQTITTTVTNPKGVFQLNFGFVPAVGKVYILEAVKGLESNAIGSDAVRVRTYIRYVGGWQTIGKGTGRIVINTSTTALATIASLRGTASVNPAALIGTVDLGRPSGDLPDTFVPGSSGISGAEFALVYEYVAAAIQEDHDPIDSVYYQTGAYKLKAGVGAALLGPVIAYVTPVRAAEGDAVTLYGSNLVPAVGSTEVSFHPGVAAAVISATRTALRVLVPAGARTGDITVTTGSKSSVVGISIIPSIGGGFKP